MKWDRMIMAQQVHSTNLTVDVARCTLTVSSEVQWSLVETFSYITCTSKGDGISWGEAE